MSINYPPLMTPVTPRTTTCRCTARSTVRGASFAHRAIDPRADSARCSHSPRHSIRLPGLVSCDTAWTLRLRMRSFAWVARDLNTWPAHLWAAQSTATPRGSCSARQCCSASDTPSSVRWVRTMSARSSNLICTTLASSTTAAPALDLQLRVN